MEAELRALFKYQPRVFSGRITLFRARRQPLICSYEPTKGWRRLTSAGVDITPVPGSHKTIIEEPYSGALANALKRAIDAGVASDG
jgi:thioesterase domain-containing protein